MRLMGIKNILDAYPEMANDEVLLWATFLKQFWYGSEKIDIKNMCSIYKSLEAILETQYSYTDKIYNADLIRKVIKKWKYNRDTATSKPWERVIASRKRMRTHWGGCVVLSVKFTDYPTCIHMVLTKWTLKCPDRDVHHVFDDDEYENDINVMVWVTHKEAPVEIMIIDKEHNWRQFSF